MDTIPETNRTTILNNGQSTCSCDKTCKNPRGLKIHQTKMGCAPVMSLTQRTGHVPGEKEEEVPVVQEIYHSLHVSDFDSEHSGIWGEIIHLAISLICGISNITKSISIKLIIK